MTETRTDNQHRTDFVSIAAALILVVLTLIRAMSVHEPFPLWDTDPFLMEIPIVGITSGYGVLLNAIMMVLGSVVVWRCSEGVSIFTSACFVIGFAVLAWHLIGDIQHAETGTTLGVMMTLILAFRAFLHRHPEWIRVVGSVVVCSSVVFVGYGLHQIYIQHPLTVESYELTRDSFLQARGWSEGSFEVQSYERRLYQPEPTGWFGLANVYDHVSLFDIQCVNMDRFDLSEWFWDEPKHQPDRRIFRHLRPPDSGKST